MARKELTGRKYEIAKCWMEVNRIYFETIELNNPRFTIAEIARTIGLQNAIDSFAAVAQLKLHDGRIYQSNRDWLKANGNPPEENLVWSHINPLLDCELDNIHTSHINQLVTYLTKLK